MNGRNNQCRRRNCWRRLKGKHTNTQREYHSCSQCTLLTVQEMFGLPGDDALKAATGFAGGIGRTGSVCGAVLGGVMALGCYMAGIAKR